jgi:hypothetical protein
MSASGADAFSRIVLARRDRRQHEHGGKVRAPYSQTSRRILLNPRWRVCLIRASTYDEPEIVSYAISPFCPTSADGLHLAPSQSPALLFGWAMAFLGAAVSKGR